MVRIPLNKTHFCWIWCTHSTCTQNAHILHEVGSFHSVFSFPIYMKARILNSWQQMVSLRMNEFRSNYLLRSVHCYFQLTERINLLGWDMTYFIPSPAVHRHNLLFNPNKAWLFERVDMLTLSFICRRHQFLCNKEV